MTTIEPGYYYEAQGDDSVGFIVKISPQGEEILLPEHYESHQEAVDTLEAIIELHLDKPIIN